MRGVALKSAMVLGCLLSMGSVGVAPALAGSAWWGLSTSAAPTRLQPGGEGEVTVTAINLGDLAVNASRAPVTLTDDLPAGLEATGVVSALAGTEVPAANRGEVSCPTPLPATSVTCTCAGPEPLPPYESLLVKLRVKAGAGASSGENEVTVSGGEGFQCKKVEAGTGTFTSPFCRVGEAGAGDFEGVFAQTPVPGATLRRPVTVAGGAVPFGVQDFGMMAENEGGAADTQAGSHPFQFTTTLGLNATGDPGNPPAEPKDLSFRLPPGFIGNANTLPECTEAEFVTFSAEDSNLCPASTAVGVASVTFNTGRFGVLTEVVPVFNLVPAVGEPARFGFEAVKNPVALDTAVRSGSDYGVTVTAHNITQSVVFLSESVTLWGVPGDSSHDLARGWSCVADGWRSYGLLPPCELGGGKRAPLLTLPTSCTEPMETVLQGDSWPVGPAPRQSILLAPVTSLMAGLEGCGRLPFGPSITVAADTESASTPTGLTVHVHVPQEASQSPQGVAPAAIKDATVALPAGFVLNPARAGGLQACAETQIGFQGMAGDGTALFSPILPSPFCPNGSKVGTVKIKLPVLPNALEGGVYVAAQSENPFGSLLALYIVAEDPQSGVLAKIPGEVALDPVTGQLVTTFKNTPQAPVEDLELHLFGGPKAPIVTPARCGTYTSSASFTPWSGNAPVDTSSSFQITSGPGGGACPDPQPFAPSFTAGTSSNQAGGFSPFSVTFSRGDQDQSLSGVSVTTPPGLLGILKSVQQCPEPQASQGTCGPTSLIGHTTATAGAGPDPVSVGGQVFLTGPYKGAPFGLSIVVPAVAGPFNLGTVVVRAAISVDPHSARITVVSDPLPSILQGIPLQLRTVHVVIDREGFMFNPTNCEPLSVGGTLTSTQGASANVSSRFQAANCATLAFKPLFTVSTQAKTSKKNGASLDVKVGYPSGPQANIRSVAVTLPKQLPSRLSTIQQACTEATFAANPASCPVGSNIGTGTAKTPVLAGLLSGPAYLVSHGGAAFPDVVVVLQGEGITLDLVGSVDIRKGVTSSTFASVPDAPIGSFELKLPEGPHSGLAAVVPAKAKGSLCGQSLTMPTTITGQNGAQVKQSTKIKVSGCPKPKQKPKAKKRHPKRGRKK
jgi:hypothetical protein